MKKIKKIIKSPDFMFQLKPLHPNLLQRRLQTSKIFLYNQKAGYKSNIQAIYPKFNDDHISSTLGFQAAYQINKPSIFRQNYMNAFNKKRREEVSETDEQQQLLIPYPGIDKKFCSVCKQIYKDYLEHVGQINHKNNIRVNKYHKYVLKECQQLIQCNRQNHREQIQEIFNLRKKVKKQNKKIENKNRLVGDYQLNQNNKPTTNIKNTHKFGSKPNPISISYS